MARPNIAPIVGRGTRLNPPNRFEPTDYIPIPEMHDPDESRPATVYLRDRSQSIIATNDSPDIGFNASINPYRGCEHGCVYCYARPTHEYVGLSAGLDFETKIFVKQEAPRLLREELSRPSWEPQVLGISGVTDAYQTVERHLELTRQCLEVLADCRNPVTIVTKSALVARDADHLCELARFNAVSVVLSVTSLDAGLARRMEPRASSPNRRLDAIASLATAGVPVGVMVAPIIPGLNDHEIPAILKAAADRGAKYAGYTVLRLPHSVKELFLAWLEDHYPDRRDRVVNRIREVRSGELTDYKFGRRMKGEGVFAEHIGRLFEVSKRRYGYIARRPELSVADFRRPSASASQARLF